ncbi:MAG: hypothetical protein QOF77_1923 [Solirubrobacteraceae bacterium]|jgi:hypothetical protein|nr:hypothetical protein [Solirubrobacteraceae bacterium]
MRPALVLAAGAALCGALAAPALAVTATATPPGAVEGAPFNTTVATFTDALALLPCPAPTQYAATITWGDGTSAAGTVSGGVGTLLGTCFYAVAGAHTYLEEGSAVYTVSITGPGGSGDTGPATAAVHDAALSARGAALSATLGTSAAATVATFTDANPGAAPGDFTAAITWGDGTGTPGTVAAPAGGGFAVTATHTYPHSGSFAVAVTIRDAGGSQATTSSLATVSGQPPGVSTPPPPAPLRLGLSTPVLARGGTVVVGVRCPVAAKLCRGRLSVATLAAPHLRVPALRTAQTLGATLFIIPGGRRAELSVRPKRAVVALLRQAGAVRVAAYASSFDAATGRSQVASLTARLRIPRGH